MHEINWSIKHVTYLCETNFVKHKEIKRSIMNYGYICCRPNTSAKYRLTTIGNQLNKSRNFLDVDHFNNFTQKRDIFIQIYYFSLYFTSAGRADLVFLKPNCEISISDRFQYRVYLP